MENLVAYRIKNARKLKQLSMQEVADELGVSKQMISKYENGSSMPTSTKLIKLSNLFGLKIDYFFRSFKIELGEVNFRKKSSFPIKKQNALKEQIKIELENYLYVEDSLSIDFIFSNPINNLIIKSFKEVENAVSQLRTVWEIGFDPIHNIIQILEDNKIKIIEIDEDDKFDGLATYIDDKYPVIVLNKNFPVERKRFSLLHELGHLILNISEDTVLDEELICNKFASEFLISNNILINELGGIRNNITYNELISIQEKYGISIQAVVYKLKEIGIINKNQHSRFYMKIRQNKELEEYVNQSRFNTPEYSKRYDRLVYRALAQEAISISKASSLLNISVDDINDNYKLI